MPAKPPSLAATASTVWLAWWLALAPPIAQAQLFENDEQSLDCVIEPKVVVELGSTEEGILRELTVGRGDIVARGDAVARLDSEIQALAVEAARLRAERDVEAQAAEARLTYRQREAERARELSKKDVMSAKAHDEAETERQLAAFGLRAAEMDRRMARIELRNAQARLNRRAIRSPVDGIVVETTLSPGEYVYEQSPVMTIAQIDPLYVEVFVPISRYGSIEVGMPGEVVPEEPLGGTYMAKVVVVDRVFDAASGTFGVRLALPNPDHRLPAGLKCRVRFVPDTAARSGLVAGVEPVRVPVPGGEAVDTERATHEGSARVGDSARSGGSSPRSAPAPSHRSRRDLVLDIQIELRRSGYDTGLPDGVLGPNTRSAIANYQRAKGLKVDGEASESLLEHLRRGSPTRNGAGQGRPGPS